MATPSAITVKPILLATISRHAALLANAGAIAGGAMATSALGFAYWWTAARFFEPAEVGLAAAAISMVLLLAQAGEIGLGPLLMAEASRDPRGSGHLFATALWAAATACGLTGAAYVALAQFAPLGLGPIVAQTDGCAVVIVGIVVSGVAIVVDQLLFGLMRSTLAMWRSIGFSVAKLALLGAAAAAGGSAMAILATWVASLAGSLLLLGVVCGAVGNAWHAPRPALLRPLAGAILSNHSLNVALQAPAYAMPVVVTVMLSPRINAAFYVAWTLIQVVQMIPAALATSAFCTGAGDLSRASAGLRLSLLISLGVGTAAGIAFLLFSDLILGLFNPSYPAIAGSGLSMLGFGTLAVAVKFHFVCVARLEGRLASAAAVLAAGGTLELCAAALGAWLGGLTGLTQGWLAAAWLQAAFLAPRVFAAAFAGRRHAFHATLAAAFAVMVMGSDQARADPRTNFVQRDGSQLVLDGKPFRVAGVNNHYLPFASRAEVVRVLDDAVAMGANVVRTFIQPVIGSPDGRMPTIWDWKSRADASDLGTRGAYALYWDSDAQRMAFNDGPNGLARFDFVIAEARRRNLRLIVAFIDFWAYTGGAQQMAAWYGGTDTYTFFAADPRTRRDYRAWVEHVLTRHNTLTGFAYRDDPTILAWELANEPEIRPTSLMVDWVTVMSAYVKSLDPNHLLASGHSNMAEPFADLAAPALDFATWHGYPRYALITHAEYDALIRRNCRLAQERGIPMLLEEFGIARSDPGQADAYRTWLATIAEFPACSGWLVWRLVSMQDSGRYPVDAVDQFDIRNDGGPAWTALREAALHLTSRRWDN